MPVSHISESVLAPGSTAEARGVLELPSFCQALRDIQLFLISGGSRLTITGSKLADIHVLHALHLRLASTTPAAFPNLVRLTLHPPALHYKTALLLPLLGHMPRLRELEIRLPITPSAPAGSRETPLPMPTLQLDTLIYHGDASIPMCARVVECSSRTLRTLRLLDMSGAHEGEGASIGERDAELRRALLLVAPRLRELRVSVPARPHIDGSAYWASWSPTSDDNLPSGTEAFVQHVLEPVFASLTRVSVLEIHTQLLYMAYWAKRLIARLPPDVAVRHLQLTRCHGHAYDFLDDPLDIFLHTPQLLKLRTVALGGFFMPARSKKLALALFRERRVRFTQHLVVFRYYSSSS